MKWLSPFIVYSVLPTDFEEVKATDDETINVKASELSKFIRSYDMEERHSVEPVLAPYSIA